MLGQLDKEQFKLIAGPLDAVIGDLREISQRAHGHAVRVGRRAAFGVTDIGGDEPCGEVENTGDTSGGQDKDTVIEEKNLKKKHDKTDENRETR